MNSGNPIFNRMARNQNQEGYIEDAATTSGILSKTLILFLVTLASAIGSIFLAINVPEVAWPLITIAPIVAFIAVMVGSFSPRLSRGSSIVYAAAEGILLGVLSFVLEALVQNIVSSALIGTVSIFAVMLVLYMTKVIKPTARLRSIVLGSLIAMLIATLLLSVLSFFNQSFDSFGINLLVSGAMIVLGAFMLILDFGRAQEIVDARAPKVFEWQAALGFMITIVWIYIYMLRFLLIIASRARD